MSLFFRSVSAGSESRSVSFQDVWGSGGPWSGGSSTESGENISPDSALRVAALWSSADLIASIVSTMPIDTFRGGGSNARTPVSPSPQIVASPSLLVTRRDWTYQAVMSLLLRGNAYGYVVDRDSLLRPRTVEWLSPDVVEVAQKSSLSPVTYRVSGQPVPADRIIHIRAFLKPGSAVGLSLVEYHKETLGISAAALKHGGKWYGGGAHPTAMLFNSEKTLTADEASTVKERFLTVLKRGGREPIVLGKDWKYQPIQSSASDSAFLDSMGYSDAQIARLFGPAVAEVLGFKTGDTMTYSNREQRTLDLLTFAIQKWLVKLEDAISGMLPNPQYVKFNSASLLRADTLTRYQTHEVARRIGLNNVDELRELEDEPPLPNGEGKDYTPLGASAPAALSATPPTEGQPQ